MSTSANGSSANSRINQAALPQSAEFLSDETLDSSRDITVRALGLTILRYCDISSSKSLMRSLHTAASRTLQEIYDGSERNLTPARGVNQNNPMAIRYLTKRQSTRNQSWLRNMPAAELEAYIEAQLPKIDDAGQDQRKMLGSLAIELTHADILIPQPYRIRHGDQKAKRTSSPMMLALYPSKTDSRRLKWERKQLEKAAGDFIFTNRHLDSGLPVQEIDESNEQYRDYLVDYYNFTQLSPDFVISNNTSLKFNKSFDDPHFTLLEMPLSFPTGFAEKALETIQQRLNSLSPAERTIELLPVKALAGSVRH